MEEEDENNSTPLNSALFDEHGKLKPVYGRPVDIRDTRGQTSTVCLWSYPLTPAASIATKERKGSVMLMRSPSAYLPNSGNTSQSSLLNARQSLLNRDTEPIDTNNTTNSTNGSSPANKSSVTPQLKVLHEEDQNPNTSSSSSPTPPSSRKTSPTHCPLHTPRITSNSSDESSLHSTRPAAPPLHSTRTRTQQSEAESKFTPTTKTRAQGEESMPAQVGELIDTPDNDEPDEKSSLGLGSVKRAFRNFNFHEHHTQRQGSMDDESADVVRPINTAQTRFTCINAERRLLNGAGGFMCGSTPILTAAASGAAAPTGNVPSTPSVSSNASNSANSDNHSTTSANSTTCHNPHHQPHTCCCPKKMAKSQQTSAFAPLNPHHDAQHAANHMCNNAENCRWLILMEPVNALHINVTLGARGRIFRADDALAAVLGYDCTNQLFGTEIHRLIPELKMEVEMNSKPQQCCGFSVKQNGVPFTAVVLCDLDTDQNPMAFNVQLRSLESINGVVTITDAGVIYSVNENFLNALTGRDIGTPEAIMLITDLIPGFYESSTIASLNGAPIDPAPSASSSTRVSECEPGLSRVDESDEQLPSTSSALPAHLRQRTTEGRSNSVPTVQVGAFYGVVRHVDGIYIPIRFDVTRLDMHSSPRLYAVGIGYRRDLDYGITQVVEGAAGAVDSAAAVANRQGSSSSTSDGSVASEPENRIFRLASAEEDGDENGGGEGLQMRIHDVTLSTLTDEGNEVICGPYSTFYDTFQLIGNGTFGSVKLAARKDSGLLAVTKFICKDKVLPESWVRSPIRLNKMIPIEVHLLETLDHQNIVKVLDVFENKRYYQLVMEKLGCGMDLFEFVESHPIMDEELTSYIFRQIVGAVEYLSNLGIVHRDIKDENVIIDGNFCCKLIDFGSAAYFGRDIVFSTFCGTMEYCSPEVLTGNKYLGPEVEMWSLGILLYTLVFYQNPFRTPQETVHAELEIPWKISDGLFQVISWLLRPSPKHRATIRDIVQHPWVTQPADPNKYKFRDVVRNSERARVPPPLYVSDLQNHLKNTSSCGNLVNSQLNNNIVEPAPIQQESGVVSAR